MRAARAVRAGSISAWAKEPRADPAGASLKSGFTTAFEYSDCWVDDARLVNLNALDAARRGAAIKTHAAVTHVRRNADHWAVTLHDPDEGTDVTIAASLVVNAVEPWVDDVLGRVVGQNGTHNIRLVQGSHIVVHKLFEHDRAYIFQNTDGRVVFAIPYEQDFTLIGTTDRDYAGSLDDVRISPEETRYICDASSAYFEKSVRVEDVVWTYSAVRPLIDDGASRAQEATRDYVLKVEGDASEVKLISIFGGKITTYRRLAETVLDHIDKALGRATQQWTGSQCLPGGDCPADRASALVADLSAAHPYLDEATARRLARSYGTLAHDIFSGARTEADLGEFFAAELCALEVDYLRQTEWAETVEDILWRRSKLGLRLDTSSCQRLADWLADHPNVEPAQTT